MTADRYTRKDAERALQRLAAATGNRPATSWNDVGGWSLDYNPIYGGCVVVEIASEGGGQSHPLGDQRRTPRAFCDAVHFALRALDEVKR